MLLLDGKKIAAKELANKYGIKQRPNPRFTLVNGLKRFDALNKTDRRPSSYAIKTVFTFEDPDDGMEHELRYAKNAGRRKRRDGDFEEYFVPRNIDIVQREAGTPEFDMYVYLSLHYRCAQSPFKRAGKSSVYALEQPEVYAEKEAESGVMLHEGLGLIYGERAIADSDIRLIASGMLGDKDISHLSPVEIRAMMKAELIKDPKRFMDDFHSKSVQFVGAVRMALAHGVITRQENNRGNVHWKWAVGPLKNQIIANAEKGSFAFESLCEAMSESGDEAYEYMRKHTMIARLEGPDKEQRMAEIMEKSKEAEARDLAELTKDAEVSPDIIAMVDWLLEKRLIHIDEDNDSWAAPIEILKNRTSFLKLDGKRGKDAYNALLKSLEKNKIMAGLFRKLHEADMAETPA